MLTQLGQEEHVHHQCAKRISWSAIAAGSLVGVGLGFLLNMFGMAIGLSAFSMTNEGMTSLAAGGLLGLVISTVIAMYCAGLTAGCLGKLYVPKRNLGIVYGFVTWSVTLILTALITTHVGHYVDTYSTTVVNRDSVVVYQDKAQSPKASHVAHEEKQQVAAVNPKEASGGMAIMTFIVFALFFIGAFACCLGAHHGMKCCKEKEQCAI